MPAIVSFGRYLPDHILSSDDLAQRLDIDPAWIMEISGIEQRRVARPDETIADMAVAAGTHCLSNAAITPGPITPGLVLISSGTSLNRFPGPASEIAHRLGFSGIPAIDLPVASAGSLFGIALAAQLAPAYGPVLVIASEKMSTIAMHEPLDKNTAILFGDGAGACLIQPGGPGLEIVDSALHSDGTWANDLKLDPKGQIHMNGPVVIMQASRKIPAAITEVLNRQSVPPESIAAFIMHQANRNLIVRVARALGVLEDRFYTNIRHYGNTSSASMLIAASEWHEQNHPPKGDRICLATFGAGFHWGAVLCISR